MEVQEYINAELMSLVPVIYIVGSVLKRSKFPDKWIPAVLGATAVVLSAVRTFSTEEVYGVKGWIFLAFTAVTQGILIAGTSVYVNQLYVQMKKDDSDKNAKSDKAFAENEEICDFPKQDTFNTDGLIFVQQAENGKDGEG